MYIAIETFHDRELKRIYNKGDAYPGEGYSPGQNWVDKLLNGKNRINRPVIKLADNQTSQASAAKDYSITDADQTNGSDDYIDQKELIPGIPEEPKKKPKKST